jgi:hypothetical protein
MRYGFLIDTYASERLKTLSVWSMFRDDDLNARPHPRLDRDRTPREHMVHQCLSEDKWFTTMFGIDVGAPPLPAREARLEFIRRYAEDSERRLAALRAKDEAWWEAEVPFFDAVHSRAWIMVRRWRTRLITGRSRPRSSVSSVSRFTACTGPRSTRVGCRPTRRRRSTRTPMSPPSWRASRAGAPRHPCLARVRTRAPSDLADEPTADVPSIEIDPSFDLPIS